MSRTFDRSATNYQISNVGGNTNVGNGAYTIICLFNVTAGNNNSGLISFRNGSGIQAQLIVDSNQLFGGPNDFEGGQTGVTTGTWFWAAIRKAAGSQHLQYSLRTYNSGSTAHQTGTANYADSGTACTTIRLGHGDNIGNASIAVWASWTSVLSDGTVAGMFTTAAADINAQSPTSLWLGNQVSSGTLVPDSVGTASGSSFNGTVGIGSDPPGYDYSLSAAAGVPYNPQRSVNLRDYGETYWIQKDRRNANLVATAANDLDVPLLIPETLRQVYARASYQDRRLVPQQPKRVGDMSLFASAANDLAQPLFQPSSARYWHLYNDGPVVDRVSWPQQRRYISDPTLLDQVTTSVTWIAPRTVQPRDPGEVPWLQHHNYDPTLLTTALLENELLGGAETDKRTNVPATHTPRWWMPQQPLRAGHTPGLLDDALLEGPLLGAANDLARHRMWFTDRREVPQQREYYDLSLLLSALLESPLNVGSFRWIITDRSPRPVQLRWQTDPTLLIPLVDADPLTLTADLWRRYNTPATHVDRRRTVRERPRWTVYVSLDEGRGSNAPFVTVTPSGTAVSQSGSGSTQQTVGVSFVSQSGTVIVSQTPGGVL